METYLSIEGLAKYLGISEKTVRKWVLNQEIPYRKIHKVIRFRLSEIERWIESGGKLPLVKDEADSTDGAAREAGSDCETGAALIPFSDDKKGAAVEAVAGDGTVRAGGAE